MAGYFSQDIYRGLAGIDAKRAKKSPECCDCGGATRSYRAPRCGPCSYERTLRQQREHRARKRQKKNPSLVAQEGAIISKV